MKVLVLVSTSLLLLSPEASGAVPDQAVSESLARFAVVIGKNESEDPHQATLRYADDDAVAMHELLEEAGVTSRLLVSPDADTAALRQIRRATKPTLNAVLRTVDALFAKITAAKEAGKQTELIFFYSGHGDVTDGEGFVVLDGGRLTRFVLLDQIVARSPADTNHIIIDACKSYFMVFDKGPGGSRRPFSGSFGVQTSSKNLDRTGFVLSASSGEDSHEWERYQAGIFSYEVRSALRGGADVDRNGLITYGELGAFVTAANRGIANPQFRPSFLVSPPGRAPRNLADALLSWQDPAGSLTVDGETAGHYYFETADGIRIADVHSTNKEYLAVHLPSTRPLFVRRADDLTEGVLTTSQSIRLSALAMRPVTTSRKGALGIAFESLFNEPFGADTVKRYDALYTQKASNADALKDAPRRSQPIEHALLGVSVATLAVGGTMSILALAAKNNAEDAAQTDIPAMNQKIGRYNTAAIALYSVGVAIGISWLTLKVLDIREKRKEVTLFPIISPTELSLGLGGTWGP